MRRIRIRDGVSGVYVAEEDADDTEYEIGGGCDAVIIVPVTRAGERTLTVTMKKPGSRAQILGFVRLAGDTHTALRTVQSHEAPDTSSDLIVKSVLSQSAVFSYLGSILVDKGAQKTDAYQRNENLLLSETAEATSSPALEIMANDVRATHGATISTLNPDEVWYLKSRGIPDSQSVELISEGFLLSAFDRIRDEAVRKMAYASYAGLPLHRHPL